MEWKITDVKSLAHVHTGSKKQSWDSNVDLPDSRLHTLFPRPLLPGEVSTVRGGSALLFHVTQLSLNRLRN